MGYMRHHAIVVTSWNDKGIESAHQFAAQLGMVVTPIMASPFNSYRSFMVCPDGSKEGWPESDAGDAARDRLLAWLDGDDGPRCAWAEVQYGDESGIQGVTRASDWGHVVSHEPA